MRGEGIMKIYSEYLGKEFDTEELKNNGDVEYKGKKLYLLQQAYIDNYGTDGEVIYKTTAIDEDGKDYTVIWTPYNNDGEYYYDDEGNYRGNVEDESNACDWDNYDVTEN